EIGVDKNTTVVFPAPLMSTIGELGSFLAREATAAATSAQPSPTPVATLGLTGSAHVPAPNGATETR
ncbi:hypothetical protein ACFYMM_42210, partial [Streptomyces sp. NPDC006739]